MWIVVRNAVALGGGHGLGVALRALRPVAENITAIVTIADDGGSSVTAIDSVTGKSERLEIEVAPHNVDLTPDGKTVHTSPNARSSCA